MNKDLLGPVLGFVKSKVMESVLNNPEKIGQYITEASLSNSGMRTFLKAIDCSAESFGNIIRDIACVGIKGYQQRRGFASSDAERTSKFASVFSELSGYDCLTPLEARILAAGYAKFSGKEIQKTFKLEGTMTVEQIQKCAEEADLRFRQAAKNANVGVVGTEIEKSSELNLEDIAKEVENRSTSDR